MQEYYYELVVKVSSYHSLFSDFLAELVSSRMESSNCSFPVLSIASILNIGTPSNCESFFSQKLSNRRFEISIKKEKI